MPVPDPIVDGDIAFVGVNARLDPGQLPEGFVANAVNKRFTNGVVKTRPGIKKMPWSNVQADPYNDTTGYTTGDYVLYSGKQINGSTVSNVTVSDNTSTDGSVAIGSTTGPASNTNRGPYFKAVQGIATGVNPLDSSNQVQGGWNSHSFKIFPYGTVYGAGVFRDPTGKEYLIVASSSGTYATRHGSHTLKLTCPTISSDVTFVQCFNVLVMMRGKTLEPLVLNDIESGFISIAQEDTDTTIDENDSDGTETIPNSDHGLFLGNRLFVPHSRDLVAVSDYLNYTRYQPVMANFRINQGSEDELVALVRVDNTTVAAFKSNSIYVVSNLYGNATDAILDEVTRDFGAVSFKSTIQVGSDVWFLSSKKGICSLSVASHGKVHAVQLPVSEAIQPIIDRINWSYAHKAVAATYGNRYYCAVCLDGAEENNAVLVYDLLQKAWSGYDQAADVLKVKEFVEMEFQGKRRLFFLSSDGYINLYDDDLTMCGFVDEVGASDGEINLAQVSDEVVTRGYTANDIAQKKWRTAEIHVATSDPKFTVTSVYDGPEENGVKLITDKTFSRTKYDKPFDKPDYDQTNTNNDFFTKYREDYSVKLAGETGGANIVLPTDSSDKGFDPDLHQSSINKYKFQGSGRYIQLKVTNTQGRLELNTVKVGALTGENLIRKEV